MCCGYRDHSASGASNGVLVFWFYFYEWGILPAYVGFISLPPIPGLLACRRTRQRRYWIWSIALVVLGLLAPVMDIAAAPGCGFFPWLLAALTFSFIASLQVWKACRREVVVSETREEAQ